MKYIKKLFSRLHLDTKAIETVEWLLLISVSLLILGVIYQFAEWAITSTSDAVKQVEEGDN